jgi:hypothetical protein
MSAVRTCMPASVMNGNGAAPSVMRGDLITYMVKHLRCDSQRASQALVSGKCGVTGDYLGRGEIFLVIFDGRCEIVNRSGLDRARMLSGNPPAVNFHDPTARRKHKGSLHKCLRALLQVKRQR